MQKILLFVISLACLALALGTDSSTVGAGSAVVSAPINSNATSHDTASINTLQNSKDTSVVAKKKSDSPPTDSSVVTSVDNSTIVTTSIDSLAIDSTTTDSTEFQALPPLEKGRARIIVTSQIDSIEVMNNGISLGFTPLVIDTLQGGDQLFILKKKGFYGKKMGIVSVVDSSITMVVDLRAPSTLYITSTPDSATILINKKRVGTTPFTAYPLRPNTYSVLLLSEGYENIDTSITLANGAIDSAHFDMVSLTPLNLVIDSSQVSEEVPVELSEKKKRRTITIVASSLLAVFVSMIFIFESAGSN